MANYDNITGRISNSIPELNNTSAASIWRRMAAVFASVIDIVQLEISRSENRVTNAARSLRLFNKQYYIDTAFMYQEGVPLTIVDNETLREGYAAADAAKQIIKQVSVSLSETGQIYVKVATTDTDGNLIPLTQNQLTAFQAYMTRFTPLGLELTVFSAEPDIFNAANLFVRYYSDFSLITIQNEMLATLHNFQTAFNPDVPLYINDVETAIKNIDGVRDVWFSGVTATYTDAGGSHTTTPENGILQLNAGYFNFNPNIYDWESGITTFTAI